VTVTLEFVDGADDSDADAAVAVLRRRIDRLELANPEIVRSRDQLTVRFDGPEPDQETIDALVATASLEFRPVCASLPTAATSSVLAQSLDPAVTGPCVQPSADGPTPTAPPDCAAPSATDTPIPASQPILAPSDPDHNGTPDACLVLGPALLNGSAVTGAEPARPQDLFVVDLTLADSALAQFNVLAAACFERTVVCPAGQTAIVLDGVVLSAPTPQTPSFTSTQIEISGNFTLAEAHRLALLLSSGALPARVEVLSVTTS
jgi:preprotein translocase subunit SecD